MDRCSYKAAPLEFIKINIVYVTYLISSRKINDEDKISELVASQGSYMPPMHLYFQAADSVKTSG